MSIVLGMIKINYADGERLGGNMKFSMKRALCIVLMTALLAGCASDGALSGGSDISDINIIDAGDYSSAIHQSELSEEARTSPAETEKPRETSAVTERTPQITASPKADEEETVQMIVIPAETEETAPPASESPEEPSPPEEVTSAPAETETSPPETEPPVTEAPETTAETSSQQLPAEVPGEFGTNTYIALNHAEVQGIWISYLEFIGLLQGKSESEFRANIAQAFDNCIELGLNTVYIHARSHSDAYYESELFPWSKYVTGTLGGAPSFDPLEIIIEEAHSRNISVQAWINPLRACSTSDMADYGDHPVYEWHIGGDTSGKYVVPVNGYYYLNPAYDEVIRLIAEGAAEIVSKYDVDGLHIDDYFYPTTDASFDSAAFGDSGYSVLSEFRFANCDRLVESIYAAVKRANPTALFSVSCQGSIENNYNLMYADVEKWCTESGYLDYIVPQIYYGFDNSTQPYIECLSRWEAFASEGGIPLVVGLTAAKIGYEDVWAGAGRTEWLTDSEILARQLAEAMECTSYGGAALYSYKSIFSAESSVEEQVNKEITAYSLIIKQ